MRTRRKTSQLGIYCCSIRPSEISAAGVVFTEKSLRQDPRSISLPAYNLGKVACGEFGKYFAEVFKIEFPPGQRFNFIWMPFSLGAFRAAHAPLAEAFKGTHGISLDATVSVVGALFVRVFGVWKTVPAPV